MYKASTPSFLKALFSDLTWNRSRNERKVYLTFDDGPIPEATPFVLDTLAKFNAKATFFCIGANVAKYPQIYERILEDGHRVGNHTFDHLNGWKTDSLEYFDNISECEKLVDSKLFRPPYGRIRMAQKKHLKNHMEIIMWDVLSADFDQRISPEKCLNNVCTHTKNGSIVVFHDSLKAFKRMSYALPRFMEYLQKKGLETECL